MQIQGIASITNGSNVIIAAAGSDWSTVQTGSLLSIIGAGGVPYTISGTTTVSGIWQATVSVPVTAATNATASVAISTHYSPNLSLPLLDPGDIDTANILSRALTLLDATVGANSLLSLSIAGAGALSVSRLRAHTIVQCSLIAGSYTTNIVLPTTTCLGGDVYQFVVTPSGSATNTLKFYSGSTSGALLYSVTWANAQQESVTFAYNPAASAFFLLDSHPLS